MYLLTCSYCTQLVKTMGTSVLCYPALKTIVAHTSLPSALVMGINVSQSYRTSCSVVSSSRIYGRIQLAERKTSGICPTRSEGDCPRLGQLLLSEPQKTERAGRQTLGEPKDSCWAGPSALLIAQLGPAVSHRTQDAYGGGGGGFLHPAFSQLSGRMPLESEGSCSLCLAIAID